MSSTEEETVTSSSAELKPVDSNEETDAISAGLKDEQSASDQRAMDAVLSPAENKVSEVESSEGNRKTVSKLSHIEDLSHIYENFLAFASAMAERSPEFQEKLYHVYENVTLALDPGAQTSTQSAEDLPDNLTGNENSEQTELGSPAMDMSSEFEKITLQENEDKDGTFLYKYSGICSETVLEKLMENANEKEQDAIQTVDVDNKETSIISGGDEDLVNHAVAGHSKEITVVSRNEEGEELQGLQNDPNCIRVEDSIKICDELNELPSESVTDVVTSQSSLQDEVAQEKQVEVDNAVHTQPSLTRADDVSAIETGESLFYIGEERNDQVSREIEGKELIEPVIETNVVLNDIQVSSSGNASSESLVNEESLDWAVEKSSLSAEYEDRTTDIKVEHPQDVHNVEYNSNSCNELASSQDDPQCLAQGKTQGYEREAQLGEHDIEGDKTFCTSADRMLEVIPNVCSVESCEVTELVTLKCTKEGEVRCEQTLSSKVCESDHALVWEEAVSQVDESPFSTTQDLELESPALLESPSTDADTGDLTGSEDNSEEAQHSDILHDTTKEETVPNDLASQTNVQDPGRQTDVIDTFGTAEEHAKESWDIPHEHAEKLQSHNTELYSNDLPGSEHLCNSPLQQDTEESEETPDEGIELEKRCSSDEEFYTPEDTIDLSIRSDSVAEEDRETDIANIEAQNNEPELGCAKDETSTAAESENVPQSEKDTTTLAVEAVDEPQREHAPVRQSEDKNLQRDNLNKSRLEERQHLTNSQMDILKAVTAAFEEILELHGEDSDADDTRL